MNFTIPPLRDIGSTTPTRVMERPPRCSLCGRLPRACGGRDLHCVDCAARIALEEAEWPVTPARQGE